MKKLLDLSGMHQMIHSIQGEVVATFNQSATTFLPRIPVPAITQSVLFIFLLVPVYNCLVVVAVFLLEELT